MTNYAHKVTFDDFQVDSSFNLSKSVQIDKEYNRRHLSLSCFDFRRGPGKVILNTLAKQIHVVRTIQPAYTTFSLFIYSHADRIIVLKLKVKYLRGIFLAKPVP